MGGTLGLLAIDLVVLRGNDPPLAIALQPGIGPDRELSHVGRCFVFTEGVLAAVNDCHSSAEEAHLGIVERCPLVFVSIDVSDAQETEVCIRR